MARPREPIELIVKKGRKHLTKAEYNERQNAEVKAPSDNIKPPAFYQKKSVKSLRR